MQIDDDNTISNVLLKVTICDTITVGTTTNALGRFSKTFLLIFEVHGQGRLRKEANKAREEDKWWICKKGTI